MKTIEELIVIRNNYLDERIRGIENIDFLSVLNENGTTLEEFNQLEGEYFLKHFNPDLVDLGRMNTNDAQVYDLGEVAKNHTFISYGSPLNKQIWYATEDSYNHEYCEKNDIMATYLPYAGGVICMTPDDLEVFISIKEPPTTLCDIILAKLVAWVQKGTSLPVTLTGNDILVDGKKVFGMARFGMASMTVLVFHISFNIDIEMIQNICLKPMVKIPSSITDYGSYTKEDFISEMISWLR